MRFFLDTNVLIAAFLHEHEHHSRALPILNDLHQRKAEGFTSAHTLLEIYSALTRLPRSPRMLASQVATLIQENILAHMTVVALTSQEYEALVLALGHHGTLGGASYDCLHLQCARKCAADRIYTFNLKHFQALAATDLRDRIVSP